jgi:hypothetical protein
MESEVPAKKRTSHEQKLRDREIELAFRAACSGIPIKLMDVPKVYAEGRRLMAAGVSDQPNLRAGLLVFVQSMVVEYA